MVRQFGLMFVSDRTRAIAEMFRCAKPGRRNRLFEVAGASSVSIDTRRGTARFPSVRAMVEADLRGWLPVMGSILDDELIELILSDAEEVLREFVTGDGAMTFDARRTS